MDQVTQQNAALVEQTTAVSRTMDEQARELHQLMDFFGLDERASTTEAASEGSRDRVVALIAWSDALSVDDPEIDQQHRQLIDIINTLHEAMLTGKAKRAIGDLIDRLIQYTVKHFQYEEGRMEAGGYPDLIEHKKRHADLVEKVLDIQKKVKSGQQLVEMETLKFLKMWLTEHIQRSDKKYSPYLQPASGRKPSGLPSESSAVRQRVIVPTKPVAGGKKPAARPMQTEKRPVATTSASDEWEEF